MCVCVYSSVYVCKCVCMYFILFITKYAYMYLANYPATGRM